MSNPDDSDIHTPADPSPESSESFADLLTEFERTNSRRSPESSQIRGTVVALSADTVFVDIGFKTEGILPLAVFNDPKESVTVGDRLTVSVKGRNPEGYYELSRIRVEQPKDWTALEKAFADKAVVTGSVTALVKGGLTVDIGLRAFMPASRSGVRDASEMEKLVGQEIRCRITKLDAATEDVVVDRRVVTEEEDRATKERRYSEVNVGDTVSGTVRSLTDFGAFIDLGGVDGLLHVGEISWTRIAKAEDLLSLGQQLEVKVLKIEPETHRISLSLKQLLPHPWEGVPDRYKVGDRVRGTVTRLADFGAFLELEPGVEGMIHISEMSWGKKIKKPGDMLTVGDTVDAVILGINPAEHRLALGLKQALGDPWVDQAGRLTPGSIVSGEVGSFTTFGAFIQLAEGIQGMVHISEIVADRRLNHPSDVLRIGEHVKAKILEFDREKRQLRLSIKQMAPTGLEDFLAEHKVGDRVTGRIVSLHGETARIELGEGVFATCTSGDAEPPSDTPPLESGVDLFALGSMLSARWKSGPTPRESKTAELSPGQIRSFRITHMTSEILNSADIALHLAE